MGPPPDEVACGIGGARAEVEACRETHAQKWENRAPGGKRECSRGCNCCGVRSEARGAERVHATSVFMVLCMQGQRVSKRAGVGECAQGISGCVAQSEWFPPRLRVLLWHLSCAWSFLRDMGVQ